MSEVVSKVVDNSGKKTPVLVLGKFIGRASHTEHISDTQYIFYDFSPNPEGYRFIPSFIGPHLSIDYKLGLVIEISEATARKALKPDWSVFNDD